MAHPKRKQSKTRTAKRRTHDKAVEPTLAICPHCGSWHIYHTVRPLADTTVVKSPSKSRLQYKSVLWHSRAVTTCLHIPCPTRLRVKEIYTYPRV